MKMRHCSKIAASEEFPLSVCDLNLILKDKMFHSDEFTMLALEN